MPNLDPIPSYTADRSTMEYRIVPASEVPNQTPIDWAMVPFAKLQIGQAILIPKADILAAYGKFATAPLSQPIHYRARKLGFTLSLSKRPEGLYIIRER